VRLKITRDSVPWRGVVLRGGLRHEPLLAEPDDLLNAEVDDDHVVGVTGIDDPLGNSELA
jgi:hypothetical protein